MKVKNLEICFLTFGDGPEKFRAASKRIEKQAHESQIFSKVICLNDQNFRKIYKPWDESASILESKNLLPNYYLGAKAWLIKCALDGQFGVFDLFCYADPGCELAINCITKRELNKLFNLAYKYGGISEQLIYPEKLYTKKYCIEYFELTDLEKQSGHVQATWSIWKNNENSQRIAAEWVEYSNPNLNLWQSPNEAELKQEDFLFRQHRGDQSIFSILWKRNELYVKKHHYRYSGRLGKLISRSVPIHTTRNRSGVSELPENIQNCMLAILGKLINYIISKLEEHEYLVRPQGFEPRTF